MENPELEILVEPAEPTPVQPVRKARSRRKTADDSYAAEPESTEFQGPAEEPQFPALDAAGGHDVPVSNLPAIIESMEKEKPTEAKSGPPSLSEWEDFFGRIVLRTATEAFLNMRLGDVMEQLTPHEKELISLSKQDLKDMSAPFASLANKSKRARKHGRAIIAASDSFEAVIALGIWLRRVNRVARKYRGPQQHEHTQQSPVQGIVVDPQHFPTGEGANGYVGNSGTNGAARPGHIPDLGVFNPGTGG